MSCGIQWKRYFSLILLCISMNSIAQMLLPIKMGQKWAYVGLNGEVLIPARYDFAEAFEGGYAKARRGDTLFIIDRNHNEIVVPGYANFKVMFRDLVRIQKNKEYGLSHFDGREIYPTEYTNISLAGFRDSIPLFLLQKDGKQGVGYADGRILVPVIYDSVSYFMQSFAVVLNKKAGLLDIHAQTILSPDFDDIQIFKNYILLRKKKKFGICDLQGKALTAVKYESVMALNDSAVSLQRGDSTICYQPLSGKRFGRESIQWLIALSNNHYAAYNKDGYYDIYNADGDLIQNGLRSYGYLGEGYWFSSDVEGKMAILDQNFEFISPFSFQNIDSIRDNMAMILQDGRWGLFHTIKKQVVIPCEFEKLIIMQDLIKASASGRIVNYQLNEKGDILEKNEFSNVVSIKLRQRNFFRSSEDVSARSGANEWFLENRLWGLRRKIDKKVLLEPQFHMVRGSDGIGTALVGMRSVKTVKIAAYTYLVSESVGLVDEDSGVIIAEPQFAYIDEDAVWKPDFEFVRVVDMSGYFHLLKRNGELKRLGMHYIDKKSANGFSRCYRGKMIPLSKKAPAGFQECIGYRNVVLNFSQRQPINWLDHTVHFSGGYWTFIDAGGNLIDNKFQYASNFNRNTAIVKYKNLFGLIGEDGQYLIQAENDSLYYFGYSADSILIAKKQMKRNAYVNSFGDAATAFDYSESGHFTEGFAPVRLENGRMSFINTSGEFLSEQGFQKVYSFSCHRAKVQDNNRFYYIDQSGKKVSETYNRAENFSEGFALARTVKNGFMFIDSNGNTLLQYKKEVPRNFSQGLAAISNGELFGYIDINGEILIPYRFHEAREFDANENAIVFTKKHCGLINKNAEWLIAAKYDEIRLIPGSNYLAIKGRKHDFYDAKGKLLERQRCSEIHKFNEGLARIEKHGKTGFIDSSGKIVIDCKFDIATDFSFGMAILPNGRRSVVINRNGDTVLNMKSVIKRILSPNLVLIRLSGDNYYSIFNISGNKLMGNIEDAFPAGNGMIRYKEHRQWGYMNSLGGIVLTPRFIEASDYSEGLARVSLNQFYEVYDFNGRKLINNYFENLSYLGQGVLRLDQGNRIAYLKNNGDWILPLR